MPLPVPNDPVLRELTEMDAARYTGETFSQSTIAEFAGVSKQAIQQIEQRAKRKLREGLLARHPELIREIFSTSVSTR